MKKSIEFIISKAIAVLAIVLGIYLMNAYMGKILPFGIETENIGIWGVWAYFGWLVSAIPFVYGIMLLFRRTISRYIRRLPVIED